ncbi:hypothetical protein JHK82_042607 [Glycine max]|nr:hypothetical protein JHK85_043270 [Glycine max]KAG5105637.1 hypothetical protein JHK82_042607 [Glycine max]
MLELSILCWVHKKSDGCTKQLPLVLYVSFGSVCALTQQHINELASDVDVKNDDPLEFLPHGFLERTKEQVESIVAVVPMITWPLCAKQRMNDALVTEGLKVGLRPKFRETDGIVEKEEIARVVKDLMLGDEGKGIHQRIGKLKDAAADALKEHGSSPRALSQFGTDLEN